MTDDELLARMTPLELVNLGRKHNTKPLTVTVDPEPVYVMGGGWSPSDGPIGYRHPDGSIRSTQH